MLQQAAVQQVPNAVNAAYGAAATGLEARPAAQLDETAYRPREAMPPAEPQQKSLRKGSRVRLVGLQSMPFLNGAEGRIADSFDKETGTFPVELHTPPQVAAAYPSVSVRPNNLERLAPVTQPATTRAWSQRADADYRDQADEEDGLEPSAKKRRAGPNFDILKSVR